MQVTNTMDRKYLCDDQVLSTSDRELSNVFDGKSVSFDNSAAACADEFVLDAYEGAFEHRLLWAVKHGERSVVEQQLGLESNIEVRDKEGNTPLLCAAAYGRTDMAEMLLKSRAHIEAQNRDGRTALMRAASHDHTDTVAMLLEYNADIHARDKKEGTALMLAVCGGYKKTVALLLDGKADIHAINNKGNGILAWAVYHNHEDIVETLIRAGVSPNVANKKGRTVLDMASLKMKRVIMAGQRKTDLARSAPCISSRDIHEAPRKRSFSSIVAGTIVPIIEEYAMSARAQEPPGNEGMIKVVEEGDSVREQRMLQWYSKALLTAAAAGDAAHVCEMLKNRADVNDAHDSGQTPLLLAARNGHSSVVSILLDSRADIEVEDSQGRTPLMDAVDGKHVEVVRILLEQHADINKINKFFVRPFDRAMKCGNHRIIQLFFDHNALIVAGLPRGRLSAPERIGDIGEVHEVPDDSIDDWEFIG